MISIAPCLAARDLGSFVVELRTHLQQAAAQRLVRYNGESKVGRKARGRGRAKSSKGGRDKAGGGDDHATTDAVRSSDAMDSLKDRQLYAWSLLVAVLAVGSEPLRVEISLQCNNDMIAQDMDEVRVGEARKGEAGDIAGPMLVVPALLPVLRAACGDTRGAGAGAGGSGGAMTSRSGPSASSASSCVRWPRWLTPTILIADAFATLPSDPGLLVDSHVDADVKMTRATLAAAAAAASTTSAAAAPVSPSSHGGEGGARSSRRKGKARAVAATVSAVSGGTGRDVDMDGDTNDGGGGGDAKRLPRMFLIDATATALVDVIVALLQRGTPAPMLLHGCLSFSQKVLRDPQHAAYFLQRGAFDALVGLRTDAYVKNERTDERTDER